jgi:hypothetical protein
MGRSTQPTPGEVLEDPSRSERVAQSADLVHLAEITGRPRHKRYMYREYLRIIEEGTNE